MTVIGMMLRGRPGANLLMVLLSLCSGTLMTVAVAYVSSLLTQPGRVIGRGEIEIVAALAVAVAGSAWAAGVMASWVVQANASAIRMELAAAVLRADYARLERDGPAVVMDLLSSRLPLVLNAAAQLPAVAVNGATLVGLYGWMLMLSAPLATAILATQAGFMAAMTVAFGRLQRRIKRNQRDRAALTGHFTFMDAGRKYLGLYPSLAADFLDHEFSPTVERVRQGAHRAGTIAVTIDSMAKASFFVTLAALLGGAALLETETPAGVGSSVLIAFLFSMVPLTTVLGAVQPITEGDVACRAIDAATNRLGPAAGRDKDGDPGAEGPISFRDLVFRYPQSDTGGDAFTLAVDALDVTPGSVLAITGANGSGKSTLGKLVAGLYRPSPGLAATPDGECDAPRLRTHFAAIWCDDRHTRFHIGDRAVGFASVAALWELLELHEVRPLAFGWIDCHELSTGQRMRVALVSALSRGRRYFLFDEFAANQDEHFAALFYGAIVPALRRAGCAVVLIAHDRQAVAIADHVRVMEHGRMVDAAAEPKAAALEVAVHGR